MTGAEDVHTGKVPLSTLLRQLVSNPALERISVGDLLSALGDRAIASLLFIFALPNVLPLPPGTSAILGAPLVFLAVQLAFGLRPWLPALIARRSMTRDDFSALVDRVGPWLARAERLLRPRATVLACPPMEYLIGAICLVLAVVLFLPIPLGNMLPALAISLLALGILERDGLWILLGLGVAVVSAVVVSGVVFVMVQAAFYFATEVLR